MMSALQLVEIRNAGTLEVVLGMGAVIQIVLSILLVLRQ